MPSSKRNRWKNCSSSPTTSKKSKLELLAVWSTWAPWCSTTICSKTLTRMLFCTCQICENCAQSFFMLKLSFYLWLVCRQLDSNKLRFLSVNCFEPLTKLVSVKLAKNPWHCDCNILYLARWVSWNKYPTTEKLREFNLQLVDHQQAQSVGYKPNLPRTGWPGKSVNWGHDVRRPLRRSVGEHDALLPQSAPDLIVSFSLNTLCWNKRKIKL